MNRAARRAEQSSRAGGILAGIVAITMLGASGIVGVIAAPSVAAVPSCTVAGQTMTCTYDAGGNTQITLPAGTSSVAVVADGAGGGGGSGTYTGGNGARVSATFNALSLSVLTIAVGAPGAAGTSTVGAGGGGFTAVYDGATATAANVLIVAGGGGGGSNLTTGGGHGGSAASSSTAAGGAGTGVTPVGAGADGTGSGGIGSSMVQAGSNGQTWAAGGQGGTAGGRAGSGGSGYGGGGGGGNEVTYGITYGNGGGGGGSFVDSVLGSGATFAPLTGSGGLANSAGAAGSITVTITGAVWSSTPSGNDASSGPLPGPWMQAYGRVAGGTCRAGWHASWAEWAITKTGGWVCNRTIYWSGSRWYESPDAVWGALTSGDVTPWNGE